MDIILIKHESGMLRPSNDDEAEKLKKYKLGDPIKCKVTKFRNYQFHKKWFALVKLAFDAWEPQPITDKYGAPEKNFDRFRKDIIIQTGRYDVVSTFTGEKGTSVMAEAHSISFGKMNEHEFAALYSSTVDVILKKILTNYTKDDIDRVIGEILNGFA